MLVDFDVRGQQGDGLFHWRKWTGIMDWYFGCNDRFVYCFIRCYLIDWSNVDYLWINCDVFISCLDSHSDGTHSLQRMHL